MNSYQKLSPLQSESESEVWNWLWENTTYLRQDLLARSGVFEHGFDGRLAILIGNCILYHDGTLAEHLRASGYHVTEEYPVGGGKTIDLVAERDGKRIAFEVETGKSDAAANVRKCLEAGMERIIVVAVSAGIHDRLARTLRLRPGVELRDGHEVLQVV